MTDARERRCFNCDASLADYRANAFYCGGSCRAAASRARDDRARDPASHGSSSQAHRSAHTANEQRPADAICRYPSHRETEWRPPRGRWRCGVCCPPSLEEPLIEWRVADPLRRAMVREYLQQFPEAELEPFEDEAR